MWVALLPPESISVLLLNVYLPGIYLNLFVTILSPTDGGLFRSLTLQTYISLWFPLPFFLLPVLFYTSGILV